MNKIILYTSILIMMPSTGIADMAKELNDCIEAELNKVKKEIRVEELFVSARAPKGKLFSCRTQRRTAKQYGEGPKGDEEVLGPPKCTLVKAKMKSRTKILECSIRDSRPVLEIRVSGRSCKHNNSATWVLKQKYQKKTTLDDREKAIRKCL